MSIKYPKAFAKIVMTLLISCLLLFGRCVSARTEPLNVGDRSQVFIDSVLVSETNKVVFTLHPASKHPHGPWLDGNSESRPSSPMILFDKEENIFKSWSATGYNTSKDGLLWGPPERNDASWRYMMRVSVIKDPLDSPDRRYKLTAFSTSRDFPPGLKDSDVLSINADGTTNLFWYAQGYNTFTSPDGRVLKHESAEPLVKGSLHPMPPGDMITGYFDQRLGLYVIFVKITSKESKYTQRRCFGVMTSPDFKIWTEPKLVFVPDKIDDDGALSRIKEVQPLLLKPTDESKLASHIYGVGGPIQLESCTIALLRMFTIHSKGGDGPSEIQLAVSRDLQKWERPFRQPVIPRGKIDPAGEQPEWDACWFNNEGPGLVMGDEIWVYYHARNTPHDHPVGFASSSFSEKEREEAQKILGSRYLSGIGIATWKKDRFVSVDAGNEEGKLTTIPIQFKGNRLELNARTQSGGSIIVELCSDDEKVLAKSKPFSGDNLRHIVDWESPIQLSEWAGKSVRLRFCLKQSELFAFAFRK